MERPDHHPSSETPEVLTDGSLQLVRAVADMAPGLTTAVRASLTELSSFMPWATDDYDSASSLEFLLSDGAAHSFAIVDDITGVDAADDPGAAAASSTADPTVRDHAALRIGGVIGVNDLNQRDRFANLGYWVRSDLVGRGMATAGAKLVANYAFDFLDVHRLEIFMSVENDASQAVAEHLGARYDGRLRGRLLLDGRYHDAHLYSLLATDDLAWRADRDQL